MYDCKEKQNTNNNSGVPTGTIINFFGDTAPEGYLSCDGTEYLKSDYPLLAKLLASLTTASLYVGSDSDHFKVPDLRGEFLRGTGRSTYTESGNGAGNVGTHQRPTRLPLAAVDTNGQQVTPYRDSNVYYEDGLYQTPNGRNLNYGSTYTGEYSPLRMMRPTNTAVLMCIKY